jgi:hypothetical protein
MSDAPEQIDKVRLAREIGLVNHLLDLAATRRSLLGFQEQLLAILDRRSIPEVQELLDKIGQQGLETEAHIENILASLDKLRGPSGDP